MVIDRKVESSTKQRIKQNKIENRKNKKVVTDMNVIQINVKKVFRNAESEFRNHHNRIQLLIFSHSRTSMGIQIKSNRHEPGELLKERERKGQK